MIFKCKFCHFSPQKEHFKYYYEYNKDALENTSPVLNTNDHPLWGDEYLGK